ncbi:MAG: hypothetical protein ACRD5H_00150 [Nitrososphaerales archaeon]
MPDEPQDLTLPVEVSDSEPASHIPEPPEPTIPVSRFRDVIAQRNELQQRMNQLQQEYEGRWQQLVEKQQKAEPEVTFEDNPAQYLKDQNEKIQKRIDEAIYAAQQTHGQTLQQQHAAQAQQHVAADEAEYIGKNPDYADAAKWFSERRSAQLEALGYSKAEIRSQLSQDSMYFVQRATQMGDSPARFFHEYIKRSGYSAPKTAKTEEEIMFGVPLPKTLAGAQGKPVQAGDVPSFKQISKMSDAQFNAMFDRVMKGK